MRRGFSSNGRSRPLIASANKGFGDHEAGGHVIARGSEPGSTAKQAPARFDDAPAPKGDLEPGLKGGFEGCPPPRSEVENWLMLEHAIEHGRSRRARKQRNRIPAFAREIECLLAEE
jgi:hypothetical protein